MSLLPLSFFFLVWRKKNMNVTVNFLATLEKHFKRQADNFFCARAFSARALKNCLLATAFSFIGCCFFLQHAIKLFLYMI